MSTPTQSVYKNYAITLHEFDAGDFRAFVFNPYTKKEVYCTDYLLSRSETMEDAEKWIDGANAYTAMRR